MNQLPYVRLGKILKKARIDAGLTQQEVAAKLGFKTAQFISNWERGISSPPLQNLNQIIDMYSMDSNSLLKALLQTQKQLLNIQYEQKKVRLERMFRKVRSS